MSFSFRTLLAGLDSKQLQHHAARWRLRSRQRRGHATIVATLAVVVADDAILETRLGALPETMIALLDTFLAEPDQPRTTESLLPSGTAVPRHPIKLAAALAALHRESFVFPTGTTANGRSPAYAIPTELADAIAALRRRRQSDIGDTITTKGHLQSRHFAGAGKTGQTPAERADKVYQLYTMDSSIRGRIDRLSRPMRKLYHHVLTAHGGLMPALELQRCFDPGEAPDLAAVQAALESAMLGTVAPLRLARFGIQPSPGVIILFTEITRYGLEHDTADAVPLDSILTTGVDLVGNTLRFLHELNTSRVLLTANGTLYKASVKRIVKHLLPIPGGFMPPSTALRFIDRFCRAQHLINRSGEHTLRPTPAGREFEQLTLLDKLRTLLTHTLEERDLPGEHYHQVRLRRILLRLLRNQDPERWHETLFLPFLARNVYLSRIDTLNVEQAFASRFKGDGYTPTENLQQICWNLSQFVTRRLYPLGLVDLGMRDGRLVAIRLSRLGAELLNADTAKTTEEPSTIVANPDFELILFPGNDEHELVHQLDRFADRLKSDHVHHFRLTRDSIQRGLRDGLTLTEINKELADRSRTPLPQNVLYSLQDWADRAASSAV